MSDKIKLLFIIDSYKNPYAGTEGQLYKLIDSMDLSKFEPHLLLFNQSDYIDQFGFPCACTVVGHSKLSSPVTWFKLFSHLVIKRREGFKLAHIFFNDPSVIAPPLLKVLGYKILISRRDMGYWYSKGYLAALRLNASLINGVVVNSNAVKEVTCQKEHIRPDKVHVIYNGYDAVENAGASVAVMEQGIVKYEKVNIGIVANIRPIKRMEDAIKAISQLVRSNRKIKLTIVGAGVTSKLESLADQLGCRDDVNFTGAQRDVKKLIEGFDIGLLCSESEGFSNAIIEYMQSRKPVVCSRVGGNPEVVINDVNGYLYDVGDVEALVECLKRLIDSEELRHKLGENGYSTVTQNYTVTRMLNSHYQIYSNVDKNQTCLDSVQKTL